MARWRKKFCLLAVTALIPMTCHATDKIIYIPIDNRPVNLSQAVYPVKRLGYEVVTPPENLLGNWNQSGNPDELWNWLKKEAPTAKAAVLSTDSLIYGSLVDSRVHSINAATITERTKRFQNFAADFPRLAIYGFGTVMRTPNYNYSANTAPPYYATHGAAIFQYTALKDKEEMGTITRRERKQLTKLSEDIPAEYLDDWYSRRAHNYDANAMFLDLTAANVFNYFLLGCDDSAIYSQTHLESRHLKEHCKDLGKTRAVVTSGADELGMLMLGRAVNDIRKNIPFFYVQYNVGKGGDTIPTYANAKIKDDIKDAIRAVGGIEVPDPARADLVIAVNTAYNGKTIEASDAANTTKPHRGTMPFVNMVKDFLDKGYPVGIADIACGNGADNALMEQLKKEKLLFRLTAYGGWNTATNSSGFLLGSGVFAKWLDTGDIYTLLMTRYLDDWAYQANVRSKLSALLPSLPGELDGAYLGSKWDGANEQATLLIADFADENIHLPNDYICQNLTVRLPWHRLFECNPLFTIDSVK